MSRGKTCDKGRGPILDRPVLECVTHHRFSWCRRSASAKAVMNYRTSKGRRGHVLRHIPCRHVVERAIDPLVGFAAGCRRESRARSRDSGLAGRRGCNRRKIGWASNHGLPDAVHGEIRIVQRRVAEEGPRGQGRYEFVEIKGHAVRIKPVHVTRGSAACSGPGPSPAACRRSNRGRASTRNY